MHYIVIDISSALHARCRLHAAAAVVRNSLALSLVMSSQTHICDTPVKMMTILLITGLILSLATSFVLSFSDPSSTSSSSSSASISSSSSSSPPWPSLSPDIGEAAENAFLQQSSSSSFSLFHNHTLFCAEREVFACHPINPDRVCFSREFVRGAFQGRKNGVEVVESMYERRDIMLTIETQSEASSRMITEMFRILTVELLGYSMKVIQNEEFVSQLDRCAAGKFDFHPQIW